MKWNILNWICEILVVSIWKNLSHLFCVVCLMELDLGLKLERWEGESEYEERGALWPKYCYTFLSIKIWTILFILNKIYEIVNDNADTRQRFCFNCVWWWHDARFEFKLRTLRRRRKLKLNSKRGWLVGFGWFCWCMTVCCEC